MFIRLLYKDANFHIYKIDENGTIKKNDEVLSNDDIIYHSTNGYDYVLLEKFDGTLTMYPLDKVIYNSFHPEIMNLGNHLKCIHLNGDLRDNRLENLKGVKEEEEWRMITYPGVTPNSYYVSSFGNVWSNVTNRMLSLIPRRQGLYKQYMSVAIKGGGSRSKADVHRYVVYEYISKNVVKDGNVVNHIDNDGTNNCVDNLEIVSNRGNSQHAVLIGVHDGLIRTHGMVETFCKLYVKNKGDIAKTTQDLKDIGLLDYFGERFRSALVRKKTWVDVTDKYFKLGDFEMPKKDQLSVDEVKAICIGLIKHNGSSKFTTEYLHNNVYKRIQFNDVNKVRYKYCYTYISDDYFTIDNKKFTPVDHNK